MPSTTDPHTPEDSGALTGHTLLPDGTRQTTNWSSSLKLLLQPPSRTLTPTICNPRISQQDSTLRWTRSCAQDPVTTSLEPGKAVRIPDDASISLAEGRFGQRASATTRFDSGSTGGAPQCVRIGRTLSSDDTRRTMARSSALVSSSRSPSRAPRTRTMSGLWNATRPSNEGSMLRLESALLRERPYWPTQHLSARYPLPTPPASPTFASPSMAVTSAYCPPTHARSSASWSPGAGASPYSPALSTSAVQSHSMLKPLAFFPHTWRPEIGVSMVWAVKTSLRPSQQRKDLALPNGGVTLPIFDAADIAKATRSYKTHVLFSREQRMAWNYVMGGGANDASQEGPDVDAGDYSADYEAGYDQGYADAYDGCYDDAAAEADHTDTEEIDEGYDSPMSSDVEDPSSIIHGQALISYTPHLPKHVLSSLHRSATSVTVVVIPDGLLALPMAMSAQMATDRRYPCAFDVVLRWFITIGVDLRVGAFGRGAWAWQPAGLLAGVQASHGCGTSHQD
ncbi:hypothetical protein ARMSODRAFT_1027293 [Armillaria solidipes]|uniref:Uncharacterized protein n=1 Tax=Armillaria solidipes TaxID=1076256 RepID=A0A2H3AL58_9AGAR|nr:hypothetical protein ARMSODRAFT_1027293 [Armillaria solidipes]